jgi:hypothetical protein
VQTLSAVAQGEEGGVKFADVPVGHIFRFVDCSCIYRRTGEFSFMCLQKCGDHPQRVVGIQRSVFGPDPVVVYDALVAMVEVDLT